MRVVVGAHLALLVASAGCGGDGAAVDGGGALDGMWSADAITLPNPDGAPPDADLTTAFDCDTIPAAPVSTMTMTGARGYHGLAITTDGDIIGSDGSSLIKSSYSNDWSVFVPGIGWGEQMDWLADGDLVMATDDGALSRITSAGARTSIANDVNAYGVVVGPDELIYAVEAWDGNVVTVDPMTGQKKDVVTNIPTTAHSAEFSPDGRRLYIGTIGDGTVYYVDIDMDGNVIDDVKVFASNVGGGWQDAIGVDACGNLYVPDYNTSDVYRVSPSGQVEPYWIAPQFESYPHGLVWGTGTNGWRADAMYLPQPYNGNTVIEIVVGAPSRDFQGTVINAQPMLP